MAANAISPYIEFKDVSKAFGDRVVLKDVNFEVLPGEMVAFLAAAASENRWRSTTSMGFLSRIPAGSLSPVRTSPTTTRSSSKKSARRSPWCPERRPLRFLTVGENVAFPLREKRELSEDQIFQVSMASSKWSESKRCATCCLPTFQPA